MRVVKVSYVEGVCVGGVEFGVRNKEEIRTRADEQNLINHATFGGLNGYSVGYSKSRKKMPPA